MADKDSNWRKILQALRLSRKPPKPYSLEELISAKTRGKAEVSERLEVSETLMARSELLYRMEPLIFSGVNKLTRRITGTRIFLSGPSEEENQKALEFLKTSGFLSLLPLLVKDAFIYGFGVAEKVRDPELHFVQIYPINFDYQREGNKIKMEGKKIAGFRVRLSDGSEETLKPEDVVIIRFYALGEFCLGLSPIEAAFKSAWIKLNLEESVGEALFRHGYPIFYFSVGDKESPIWKEVTPQHIKDAKDIIPSLDSVSELILPWWIKLNKVEPGGVGDTTGLLEFLSMEILAALEMPKAFGTQTRGLGGRAVEEMDFEKTIIAMQQELKRQIEEQVLIPYYKENNFKTKPELNFVEYAPELQNASLRRLAAYAKHGLITRTDDLENELRKREGFLPKKKKKKEQLTSCIFGLGECPIRQEEDMPLDKLAAFCNICPIRQEKEAKIKNGATKDDSQREG
ncbi:MAG: hypothetical protein DRJ03_06510 [Chloroflexi bacterium]|nr:MAG: hypothetical protein DRJ03_06510 [Chloroflexota bacterium]